MEWTAFIVASVLLTLSPGPDILYVVMESISKGKQVGIAIAIGLCSGLIIHTSAAALGISILVRQNEWLFNSLKIIGAIYLLYLAYQTIRYEWREMPGEKKDELNRKTSWAYFKRGFTMNVINPKVTLFFLAFLPQFLPAQTTTPFWDTTLLGLIFMLQAFLIFGTVAFLSGQLKSTIKNPTFYRGTLLFKVGVLLFIAFQILSL